ncbi:hypothetical protein [Xanthomonas arboricola]|uniref:Uncharacterized protein n=1 Tax=Xanthomonas arboricola TaxID=56448 RepID=A0AAU9I357_9XANT|nr:hypothetical protein [Xanthomonas arboricola]CAE6845465.1 hypothetical protein XA1314C_39370 [Xanthomonas arboricola]CAE6845483.1 hypothetical protein XA1314C_39370 [Xanthomonas arboricola]
MWPINLNRRAVIAITTLAIACIASNPGVAAAIPLLEMVGIDVFAYLLASRLGPVLLQGVAPVIRVAYMRRRHRLVRPLGHAVNCRLGGYLRQVSWYTG